jgi:cell division protein FtsN
MAAKRGGKTQAKRGGGMKTGLVLVVGLVIGLAMAAAYLVFGDRQKLDAILPQPNPQAEAPAPSREAEPVAQEPEAQPDAAAEAPKPTYDFYTVLPEKEVELPGESAAAATASGSAAPASTASTTTAAPDAATTTPAAAPAGLQLQAGAFSNAGDAEALRARLALVGQTARIETVQADGRTLHRVRLGPYADVAAREAAQKALAEAGVTATPAR